MPEANQVAPGVVQTVESSGPDSMDAHRFRVDAQGTPTLIGGCCGHCGCLVWGVRAMCPRCWATDKQEEVALPHSGSLYSMTTVQRAPGGYRAPYAVGVVDLPGDVRVFGRIHWPDGSRWRPGAEMELIVERVDFDGGLPSILVPAFRPKKSHSHA